MISSHSLVFRTLMATARERPSYDESRCRALLVLLATSDGVRGKVRRCLKDLTLSDLQFATLVVLYSLDPEPALPAFISLHANTKTAIIRTVLGGLRSRGLIEYKVVDGDQRERVVVLTDLGRELAEDSVSGVLEALMAVSRNLVAPAPQALLAICERVKLEDRKAVGLHLVGLSRET